MTDVVVVWSERDELYASSLKDCAYSAILMCLVWGGFAGFPLGRYTAAEREALERADDRPNETGASITDVELAIKRRYDLTVRIPTPNLATLLDTPGIAVTVGGLLANLPDGDWLRRWAPDFVLGHRVCVITLGQGQSRWLDPLAPWKFAGDVVSNTKVVRFAGGRTDARYVKSNEFAASGGVMVPGGDMQPAPITDHSVHLVNVPAGESQFDLDAVTVMGKTTGRVGTISPYGVKNPGGVTLRAIYVGDRLVLAGATLADPAPAPAGTYTAEQLASAVATARADEKQRAINAVEGI